MQSYDDFSNKKLILTHLKLSIERQDSSNYLEESDKGLNIKGDVNITKNVISIYIIDGQLNLKFNKVYGDFYK